MSLAISFPTRVWKHAFSLNEIVIRPKDSKTDPRGQLQATRSLINCLTDADSDDDSDAMSGGCFIDHGGKTVQVIIIYEYVFGIWDLFR